MASIVTSTTLSNATSSSAPAISPYETLPPDYYEIFQVSTASVSLISSLVMAASIAFFGNMGLSTPYRRIIFGLSIADIMQSFAFVSGPSAVPPLRFSETAESEVTSCQVNAFALIAGSTGVMTYTVFLCLYYLCKLKYRMSDQAFRYRIETKVHAFIVLLSGGCSVAGVTMNLFHTNPHYLSFCGLAAAPTRCRTGQVGVGACDETQMARVLDLVMITSVVLPLMCLSGIIITMGLLYQHASALNQLITREVSVPTSLRNVEAKEEKDDALPRVALLVLLKI